MSTSLLNEEAIKTAIQAAFAVLVATLALPLTPAHIAIISTTLARIIALVATGRIRQEEIEQYTRARVDLPDFSALRSSLEKEALSGWAIDANDQKTLVNRPDEGSQ